MDFDTRLIVGWWASIAAIAFVFFFAGVVTGGRYVNIRKEPPRDYYLP